MRNSCLPLVLDLAHIDLVAVDRLLQVLNERKRLLLRGEQLGEELRLIHRITVAHDSALYLLLVLSESTGARSVPCSVGMNNLGLPCTNQVPREHG